MPKMQSEKARDIKYNGELAKQKLANKLKCPSCYTGFMLLKGLNECTSVYRDFFMLVYN